MNEILVRWASIAQAFQHPQNDCPGRPAGRAGKLTGQDAKLRLGRVRTSNAMKHGPAKRTGPLGC
jgi:hypothetical protein